MKTSFVMSRPFSPSAEVHIPLSRAHRHGRPGDGNLTTSPLGRHAGQGRSRRTRSLGEYRRDAPRHRGRRVRQPLARGYPRPLRKHAATPKTAGSGPGSVYAPGNAMPRGEPQRCSRELARMPWWWPQLCGLWPTPSPGCPTVGIRLTRCGCLPTWSTRVDQGCPCSIRGAWENRHSDDQRDTSRSTSPRIPCRNTFGASAARVGQSAVNDTL